MARASLTFDEIVELSSYLPGVEEGTSYGTRALKVKGKLLVRLKEDGETVVLRASFVVRDILMREKPKVFFVPEHYRNYPTVLAHLSLISRKQLVELIESAWRDMAPKKLVQQFDEGAP